MQSMQVAHTLLLVFVNNITDIDIALECLIIILEVLQQQHALHVVLVPIILIPVKQLVLCAVQGLLIIILVNQHVFHVAQGHILQVGNHNVLHAGNSQHHY